MVMGRRRLEEPITIVKHFLMTRLRDSISPEGTRTVAGGPSEASDHRLNAGRRFPTPAGVTEEIHAIWYLVRDPAGVVKKGAFSITGGRSLRSDHRLPSVPPPEADLTLGISDTNTFRVRRRLVVDNGLAFRTFGTGRRR